MWGCCGFPQAAMDVGGRPQAGTAAARGRWRRRAASAPPAGQLLYDLSGGRAPFGQQHQEVVDDIGRLFDDPVPFCSPGLVVEGGGNQLGGFFDQFASGGGGAPGGQPGGVGTRVPRLDPVGDGAPEGFEVGEALRPGAFAGGGEAGAGVGVADGSGGGCFYQQSVAAAVYGQAGQGEVLPLVHPCAIDPRFVYDSPL